MASLILDGLNEQQIQAVSAPDGPVLILAGPGSGKTRVLTRRIAYLVAERGIPPHSIMAVTFTNKAAREMRARVQSMIGDELQGGMRLGTFHATCAYLLRREADQLPITRDYVIFDTSDQRALMKSVIVNDLELDEKRYRPQRVLGRISQAKNELITWEEFRPADYFDEIVRRAYQIYQERLLANNAVDFDDLLLQATHLLEQNEAVRSRYQRTFTHVLVDEFQDTNFAQYRLIKVLAAPHDNLFCVGDEDQSIYRWRGADYRNLNRFREDYPKLHVVLLEQNYRSTQTILNAARAVIDKNPNRTPKKLFTEAGDGPQILIYEAHDENYEARFIVDSIASLTAMEEVEPGQCAIMYRTNAQSRVLEDAFVRAGLPYRLVGATRFYGRREIKDVLAYLRVIHNPSDTISLMRVINTPPRGIGKKTIGDLDVWAERQDLSMGEALQLLALDPEAGPFGGRARNALLEFANRVEGWRSIKETHTTNNLLKIVLDETHFIDSLNDGTDQGTERVENVMELLNVATEFEELPLTTFLEEVALVSEVDDLAEHPNAPSLLTLHAAKGLEFDCVFLVGLEEGMLPHDRSKDDPEAMAEERRLMYVGVTRARRLLYLIYAFRRTMWGESTLNLRSRFVDDIPGDLTTPAVSGGMGITTRPRRSAGPPRVIASGQPSLFRSGQRVMHPKFGEGIVIECRASGEDQEISVAFEDHGLKRLLASFANLTHLEG